MRNNIVCPILGAAGLPMNPVYSCLHGTCHTVQVISPINDEEKRQLTEIFNCQCSGKYSGEFCEIPFDHCAGNFVSLTSPPSEKIHKLCVQLKKTSLSVKMESALIYPKKELFAVSVATSGKAQIFAQTPLVARISIQIEPCRKFVGKMADVTMKMMIFYVIAMGRV